MEQTSFLPWLVPLCPLVGFLINAFVGARLTGSPRPIVEDGTLAPATAAVAHNVGPSDGATFDPNPAVTAAGHDSTAATADPHTPAAHGHGEAEVHLNPAGKTLVGAIATLSVAAAFVVSLLLFFQVAGMGGESHRLFSTRWDWMSVPAVGGQAGLNVGFGLVVDPLSSLMLLIITGIGTLIHLYSVGYMAHDKGYARYFSYLNLFVFFMLLLVMGANLPVLFVGWEGVGLASYLLVGFYYDRKSATDAGKKAFIVNRIGDCALLVAMFLLYKFFGTLEFYGANGILTATGLAHARDGGYLQPEMVAWGVAAATVVPLLMLLGAAGKSAQIPLYIWLPDAMEGPTPVSALIHAATMVTGGVYLVARTHDLFLLSPVAMTVMAVVGLTTAFLAATIALVQTDIKRVLAYSTVSQLGYMFLACGVGAFSTAMFHVTTHAFFKALLFLGAGSVIHAMGGEQDMRRMGALGKRIPLTWAAMLTGTLALAGIPPLAGFWSKDEILLNAFAGAGAGGLGHPLLWAGGFVVSGLTAFYMVRLMMKTFAGAARYDNEVASHIHESPATMTLPLVVLAGLSVVGGFLNAGVLHLNFLDRFLGNTASWRETANTPLRVEGVENVLLIASAVLAIVVCVAARMAYANKPTGELSTDADKARNGLWRILHNKWGVDEFWDNTLVEPGRDFARFLWRFVDVRIVDGAVNGTAFSVAGLAQGFRRWQSGYVRNYAFSMLIGVVVVVVGCLLGLNAAAGH